MRALSTAILAILAAASAAAGGEVSFSAKPTAVRDGDKVKITFSVAVPTDVEVAVLGADGKVVRHLAAGVLGAKLPPPEPLKAGLAQEIVWDGRDDLGKAAAGGPFKVRVRAGTQARLGKIFGFDPYRMTYVHGLATDEQGLLHVLFRSELNFGAGPMRIRVFDREGKYLKTIMPYPADLPMEKAAGFGLYTGKGRDEGCLYPANSDALAPKIYRCFGGDEFCLLGHRVRNGRILLFTPSGWHGSSNTVFQIAADGSCPDKAWEVGRMCSGWGEKPSYLHLPGGNGCGPWTFAVSPDGKTVYAAGFEADSRKEANYDWPPGRVHRLDLTKPLLPVERAVGVIPKEKFADTQPEGTKPAGQGRADWGLYTGTARVMGLDVSDDGTVYACDRGNKRLAAYDAQGKLLGSTAIEDPDCVAVHPKTKEVYVLTRKQPDKTRLSFELVKLSGFKDGQELARLTFKEVGRSVGGLALDASGDKPVLWVLGPGKESCVWRVEDQGASLQITGELSQKAAPDGLDWSVYCFANPANDQVFVQDGWGGMARFDGLTGKKLPGWKNEHGNDTNALDVAFDLAGNVYLSGFKSYATPVARFTPDMQPLAFGGTGKNITSGKPVYGKFGTGNNQKGLAVGPDGTIYSHHMLTWAFYGVITWKPDGTQDKEMLLGTAMNAGGIKVDLKNNLYLGVDGVPKGYDGPACHGSVVKMAPASAKGMLQAGFKATKDNEPVLQKLGAAGEVPPGEPVVPWIFRRPGGEPAGETSLRGVAMAYPGVAPLSARACSCKELRFDLDRWGRLYLPNTFTFSVRMVDNAGNEILKFGHYGNPDSQGGGKESPIKKPEIPLGWPMTVAATESGRVYVGDYLNTRVVRVDLTFAAEETCEAK